MNLESDPLNDYFITAYVGVAIVATGIAICNNENLLKKIKIVFKKFFKKNLNNAGISNIPEEISRPAPLITVTPLVIKKSYWNLKNFDYVKENALISLIYTISLKIFAVIVFYLSPFLSSLIFFTTFYTIDRSIILLGEEFFRSIPGLNIMFKGIDVIKHPIDWIVENTNYVYNRVVNAGTS